MTTTMTEAEASIQAQLDAEPWSAALRRMLADHLEDVGDERAAGYRALGVLGLHPYDNPHFVNERPWQWGPDGIVIPKFSVWAAAIMPRAWCSAIDCPRREGVGLAVFPTRREADDAAAKAFARLPADVQAVILAGATE